MPSFTALSSWCRTKLRTPVLRVRTSSGRPRTNCSITWGRNCSSPWSPSRPWCPAGLCSSTIPPFFPRCRPPGCWVRRNDSPLLTHLWGAAAPQRQRSTWRVRGSRKPIPWTSLPLACWLLLRWGWGWEDWVRLHRGLLSGCCRRPTRWLPWGCPLRRRGPCRWWGCVCRMFCRGWACRILIQYKPIKIVLGNKRPHHSREASIRKNLFLEKIWKVFDCYLYLIFREFSLTCYP